MKKFVILLLAILLTVFSSVSGTLAYMNLGEYSSDIAVNGSVRIEQIEQEWNADHTALKEFTQSKPLYPCVGNPEWDKAGAANPAYRWMKSGNAVDKYVTVKNNGLSGAYVRTFIALEMGDYTMEEFDMVGIVINDCKDDAFSFSGNWEWTADFVSQINGHNSRTLAAVYQKPLLPGQSTIPSLLQVYLSNKATNNTLERLDGNNNGTYDIHVYTQAVQLSTTATDAATALNESFGDTGAKTPYHPWQSAR